MKLSKLVLYIYLFIIPFYPSLSFISIAGFPIITIINIFVLALLLVKFFLAKRFEALQFFLVFSIILSFVISIISGWNITKCITNISLYIIPIMIFVLVKETSLSLDTFTNIITFSLAISAILSILALAGVLNKTSNYYINIYYVDGASGIIGIILFFYRLFTKTKKYNLIQTILLGVFGFIVVLLGQSRARFLIAAISAIVVMFSFLLVFKSKGNKLFFRLSSIIVLGIIVLFMVYRLIPTFAQYIDNIFQRINDLGKNDENVISRVDEMQMYLTIFKENFLIGKGWGLLNNPLYLDMYSEQYMAHNMFVGLLGVGGLLFCLPFFIFLFSQFRILFLGVFKEKKENIIPSFVSIICLLLLSVSSSGFGKLSGVLFMTIVYITTLGSTNSKIVFSNIKKHNYNSVQSRHVSVI